MVKGYDYINGLHRVTPTKGFTMPSIKVIEANESMQKTAVKLTKIFQQSTGRALCDSGDAYGRNWERNQKFEGWKAFAERPEAYVDTWNREGFPSEISSLDLDGWHYVVANFEYSKKWQKRFNKFAKDSTGYHLTDMEDFAAKITGFEDPKGNGKYGEDAWSVWNTYNDDTFLNEVFQIVTIPDIDGSGEDLFLLSYHGGADVRGGYTSPIALVGNNEDWYSVQSISITCKCTESTTYDFMGGDINAYNHDTQENEYLTEFERCPNCGNADQLEAYPHGS